MYRQKVTPAKQAVQVASKATTPPVQALNKLAQKVILAVAIDDALFRKIYSCVCATEQSGFTLRLERDVARADQSIANGNCDFVIVGDVGGETDQAEAIRAIIRQLGGTACAVPTLVVTALEKTTVEHRLLEFGLIAILDVKQLTPNSLLKSIGTAETIHNSKLMFDEPEAKGQGLTAIPGAGFWTFNFSTRQFWLSQNCFALLGIEPKDGALYRDDVMRNVVRQDRNLVRQSFDSGGGAVTVRIELPEGGIRHVFNINQIEYDSSGHQQSARGVMFDISDHVKARQELARTQRRLNQFLDTSLAGLTEIYFSGVFETLTELKFNGIRNLKHHLRKHPNELKQIAGQLQVLHANAAALELSGLKSVEDFDFAKWVEIEGNAEVLINILEAIWRGEPYLKAEFMTHSVARPEPKPMLIQFRVPQTRKEAASVPVALMDMTMVHNAESARRANDAKTRFLANMSHEIRTPLHSVIGNLELLQDANLDKEASAAAATAHTAAEHLLTLIDDILDISKIESDALHLEHVETDFDTLVANTLTVFQSTAREKGLFVSVSVDGTAPTSGIADPVRLKQILTNLISNAIKFTEQGGVCLDVQSGTQEDGTPTLIWSVHDSGPGVSTEHLERIFDSFEQENDSITRRYGGTGLGLAISRKLAELMGGSLRVSSVRGQGTTMTLEVPVQRSSLGDGVNLPDLSRRTVLIVGPAKSSEAQSIISFYKSLGAKVEILPTSVDASERAEQLKSQKHTSVSVLFDGSDGHIPSADETDFLLRLGVLTTYLPGTKRTPELVRQALRSNLYFIFPDAFDPDTLTRTFWVSRGSWALVHARDDLTPVMPSLDCVDFEGRSVLVLEDKPLNRHTLARQLKKIGVDFTLVEDGAAGLEAVKAHNFDVILSDVSMPVMDGLEFTRQFRAWQKKHSKLRTPVIALTANAFLEDMATCLDAGMDDFVSKPLRLRQLKDVLIKWMVDPAQPDEPEQKADGTDGQQKAVDQSPTNKEPINLNELFEIIGDEDTDLAKDLLLSFAEAAKMSFTSVKEAVAAGDAGAVTSEAHGAKGEALNAAAPRLAELYKTIEQQAKQGSLRNAQSLLTAAQEEIDSINHFIANFSARSGGGHGTA